VGVEVGALVGALVGCAVSAMGGVVGEHVAPLQLFTHAQGWNMELVHW
jgi:hypothetical protein